MRIRRNAQILLDFNRARLELLATELKVGHTFASIALGTKEETNHARNRANAREAYDTALRILSDATLTGDQAARINEGVQQLKRDLELLGETGLRARTRRRRVPRPLPEISE